MISYSCGQEGCGLHPLYVGSQGVREVLIYLLPTAPLPAAAPSLQDEVREAEAGQLRTLERENQELRGLLQALQRQQGDQVSPTHHGGVAPPCPPCT